MVERLAALLRLADALDRQHAGLIRAVAVRQHADRLELAPELGKGESSMLTLEHKAVAEKGALFTQLFGLGVELQRPKAR